MNPMFAVFGLGFGEIALAVVVVVVLIGLLNFRALKRLFNAGSVQVGKVGRWASNKDPLAVYQERIDEGTEKIGAAKGFLGQAGGEVRAAKRDVADRTSEVTKLNNRIDVAEKAGDPNNTLEGYALELADAEERLGHAPEGTTLKPDGTFDGKPVNPSDNGAGAIGRLYRAMVRFDNFSAAVLEGQTQVEEARKEARELGMELEQSQREKEMNAFASSFNPDGFMGGDDNGLKAAREKLKQQIDDNRGATDADAALNVNATNRAKDRDLDRKARAEAILAARRAKKPTA
jgi:hypothetical protein